jgi:hypothetical protein
MTPNDYRILRGINRDREVQAMREGRRIRATTIPDKRKAASKNACRDRRSW